MDFKHDIPNECAFHHTKGGEFCSPDEIIDGLHKFAKKNLSNREKGVGLLTALKNRYDCKSESCILTRYEVKEFLDPEKVDEVLRDYFKPEGPKFSRAWLSNDEIDAVLDQIAKKYEHRHFLHIPYQMRDFQKTGTELATMDWQKKYEQGYRTFGTVVNTDYSIGKGIHWFALFGDFDDNRQVFTIEYFNSSGENPLPEISEWMKNQKYKLQLPKPVKDVVVTNIVNQNDTHSCGPYSLYYILSRLDGVPMEWFRTNRIGDQNMLLFRQYLFRDKTN
jgi:hypothetical protein